MSDDARETRQANMPTGADLLQDPALNKGTAFTESERDALGLRGLLPPHVSTQEEQVTRIIENFRRKQDDLEKYIGMIALQDRNETLFYRVIAQHIEEMLPIIYTPTVGRACQEYGLIFRNSRGLYVSASDKGRVAEVLRNWEHRDVRVIVVTDGERILGLGDLGANGMGIPVGKLSLYTACAGIDPGQTLPIMLDVGTENETLRNDPLYLGLKQARLRGDEYDEFVREFVLGVQDVFPKALIQFEDFANANAFRLLDMYRDEALTFNDDIQGTAAVAVAGLIAAMRITGGELSKQKLLFLGAGSAATGIADLVVAALADAGEDTEEARRLCWFVDSKGLVVKSRNDLTERKLGYAHDHKATSDFASTVRKLKPTAIIGVSGTPKTFTREILEFMAEINERPIVFALSNPTSQSECTAEEAYRWTDGRAIFASGSPFAPVEYKGRTLIPGQGNNAYIFPGVGLGVVVSGARRVTDEMFLEAARTLSTLVTEKDLEHGNLYPPLSKIRDVSKFIAVAVARVAYARGLTTSKEPPDLAATVESQMYVPTYRSYA